MKYFLTCVVLVFTPVAFGTSETENQDLTESIFHLIESSVGLVSRILTDCKESELSTSRKAIRRPHNCFEIFKNGDTQSGIKDVYPFPCCPERKISVYCDQEIDGGGWTRIQHREPSQPRENFSRNWAAFKLGFGNLEGEFWLGLEKIHALVHETLMELRIDLEDFEGDKRYAKYDHFYIEDAQTNYKLNIGNYSGNAGDSLFVHNNQEFSTKDRDNDHNVKEFCARDYNGAWWHHLCHHSNLNGFQHEGTHASFADGINWFHFRGHRYSLMFTTMSIRPT